MKDKNSSTRQHPKFLLIALLFVCALVFGLIGGAVSVIFLPSYLPPSANQAPVAKPVDNSQDNLRQANAIIENAKKIIAGQENKINDTISSAQNSLVGVFKKNPLATTSSPSVTGKDFDISAYYKNSDAIGEGIVVTSDGWILTSDFTKGAATSTILKNFVVITKTNDVYSIDKVISSGINSYLFIHLAGAKNLSVKSFINEMDLTSNQSLLALNWQGESYLTSIVNQTTNDLAVKDSDSSSQNIIFSNTLGDYFDNAFIFSLDSQVVGYFDKKNGPVPLYNFQSLIKGLLQGQQSQRASLGVSYVNLQDYAIKDTGYDRGALIYANGKLPAVKPGSAADQAGLRAGDVIISADNTNIDATHDLGNLLQKYSAGDQINLIYLRQGTESSVGVKLQALK